MMVMIIVPYDGDALGSHSALNDFESFVASDKVSFKVHQALGFSSPIVAPSFVRANCLDLDLSKLVTRSGPSR